MLCLQASVRIWLLAQQGISPLRSWREFEFGPPLSGCTGGGVVVVFEQATRASMLMSRGG